ncbi:MAG: putative transposase [Gammaproteobacteria bacterium]|nr:putative transposase [Gammaproteobacteria bacterium]
MAGSYLSASHFHDEAAALPFVEARVSPKGPLCDSMQRIGRLQGKSTRYGMMKCYNCREPFTALSA